jgi:N6-L-threonylcarbamoyladenine synthase
MIYSKDYDFSFSGLKTAVLYDYKKQTPETRKSKTYIQVMAREIQQAIIDVLLRKTLRVARNYKAKTIILGGGVAANQELRRQFLQRIKKEKLGLRFQVPGPELCTDNAAMVAGAGYYVWLKGKTKKWEKIEAKANLRLP